MRYIWITGLNFEKQKIDNEYVAGANLEIETMKLNAITGFEFQLPVSELPNMYTSSSFASEITENIKYNDTTIKLESTSSVSGGEHYWIKTELIYVNTVVDATTLHVTRGKWGTYSNNYYLEYGPFYLTSEPPTLVGLRVILYEDDKTLAVGIISENPTVQDRMASFNVDGLEKTLNTPLPTFNKEFNSFYTARAGAPLLFWTMQTPRFYKTEIPPFSDFFEMSQNYGLLSWSDQKYYFSWEKFKTIKDFLDFYAQVNFQILSFDQSIGKYRFIGITAPLSIVPPATIELSKFLDISKSPESQLFNGISNVAIKLSDKERDLDITVITRSPQINSYNSNQQLKLDFTDTTLLKSDAEVVGLRYVNQFSIVYSQLKVPTSSYIFEYFEEGKYYFISDIEKFYTFQSVSNLVLCTGKDNNSINFLVMKNEVKKPITPGIPVIVKNNTEAYFGWDLDDWDNPNWTMRDFIQTIEEDFLNAKIPEYDIAYFADGDKIKLVDLTGTVVNTGISTVHKYYLEIPSAANGLYWFYWRDFDDVTARQIPWFFYSDGVY